LQCTGKSPEIPARTALILSFIVVGGGGGGILGVGVFA